MFERYTEPARRVLFFARYEASHLGHQAIESDDILLGLVRERKGVSAQLFADAGIELATLRAEIVSRGGGTEQIPQRVEIPVQR